MKNVRIPVLLALIATLAITPSTLAAQNADQGARALLTLVGVLVIASNPSTKTRRAESTAHTEHTEEPVLNIHQHLEPPNAPR